MVNTIYLLSFVETPRKFIIAIINLRGVSTKLNKYINLFLEQGSDCNKIQYQIKHFVSLPLHFAVCCLQFYDRRPVFGADESAKH